MRLHGLQTDLRNVGTFFTLNKWNFSDKNMRRLVDNQSKLDKEKY